MHVGCVLRPFLETYCVIITRVQRDGLMLNTDLQPRFLNFTDMKGKMYKKTHLFFRFEWYMHLALCAFLIFCFKRVHHLRPMTDLHCKPVHCI